MKKVWLVLKRFFEAPVFVDEEKTRVARHIFNLLLVVLVFAPTAALIFYLISPASMARALIILLPISLIFLIAALMAKRGWVNQGAFMIVLVAWIASSLNNYFSGGLKSPGFGTGTVLVIVLAGLLLGKRGAFVAIVLNVILALTLASGEIQSWVPDVPSSTNVFSITVSYLLNMIVAGSLVYITIGGIQDSLDRARLEIRERSRIESDLQRRADEMSLLYQIGISLTSGKDLRSTLLALQSEIERLIEADAFYIAFYDEATDVISYPIFFERGELMNPPDRKLHQDPGFSGAVILQNRFLYLQDMTSEEIEEKFRPYHTGGQPLHTFLGIPLLVNDKVIGMMSVQSKEVDAYTPQQLRLMETIAAQAAFSIEKARLLDQLKQELYERERAERALDFSEKRFYQAFQTSPVMMTIEGPDNVFVSVNQSFMDEVGYSREEIIGHRASDINLFAQSEDRQIVARLIAEGKPIKNVELHFRKKSGEVGTALLSSDKFEANGMSYELTSALDITDRKQAEMEREKLITELKAKNIELEQFTYVVSHDLRAPIITVKGFLGFLEQDILNGNIERVRSDVKRISDATDKMNLLLNELLDLSRVGRLKNESRNASFESIVADALQNVHGALEKRGVAVQTPPQLPAIYGDRQRLVEVLQNLFDNAVKFMGDQPEPRIEVGLSGEEDDMFIFFVKDNGIGIAPEHHERIFGLFNKLNLESDGTGLGLAIVRRIIEVHGGRIWVESETGKGAAFYFTLPRGRRES